MTITGRIVGGFEHARIMNYKPVRLWLSPTDYCAVMDVLPMRTLHTVNGVPVSLDRWDQGTRIILAGGHRIWF